MDDLTPQTAVTLASDIVDVLKRSPLSPPRRLRALRLAMELLADEADQESDAYHRALNADPDRFRRRPVPSGAP